MLNESMGLIPPADMSRIIKKDALYNAIGLAAFELFDEVDFDRWFSQVRMVRFVFDFKAINFMRKLFLCCRCCFKNFVSRRAITAFYVEELYGSWASGLASNSLSTCDL